MPFNVHDRSMVRHGVIPHSHLTILPNVDSCFALLGRVRFVVVRCERRTPMRLLRSLVWGVVGAVPGLILLAIPGFIDSQAENLLMTVGGMALALAGFGVGAVTGWVRGSSKDES